MPYRAAVLRRYPQARCFRVGTVWAVKAVGKDVLARGATMEEAWARAAARVTEGEDADCPEPEMALPQDEDTLRRVVRLMPYRVLAGELARRNGERSRGRGGRRPVLRPCRKCGVPMGCRERRVHAPRCRGRMGAG